MVTSTPTLAPRLARGLLALALAGCSADGKNASHVPAITTSFIVSDLPKDAPRQTIPRDYEETAFGFIHPSCVVHLKADDEQLEDGSVRHADGTLTAMTPCDQPSYDVQGHAVPVAPVTLYCAPQEPGESECPAPADPPPEEPTPADAGAGDPQPEEPTPFDSGAGDPPQEEPTPIDSGVSDPPPQEPGYPDAGTRQATPELAGSAAPEEPWEPSPFGSPGTPEDPDENGPVAGSPSPEDPAASGPLAGFPGFENTTARPAIAGSPGLAAAAGSGGFAGEPAVADPEAVSRADATEGAAQKFSGYMALALDASNGPLMYYTATWTVPDHPSAREGQRLSYWPGLEVMGSKNPTVLQPVLRWYAREGGWVILAEHCCRGGSEAQGDHIRVNPGDTILGTMAGVNCDANGRCEKWVVMAKDQTTGQSSQITTSGLGQAFDAAMVSFEGFDFTKCAHHSASGSTTFSGFTGIKTQGGLVPGFKFGLYPPNANSPCHERPVPSGDGKSVQVLWDTQ